MILVTGGAGYIGSHCVKQLMAAGREVVILDDLSTGYQELILSPHFVEGRTTDRALLNAVFKKYPVTAVMHFAAYAYVGESVENPAKYYENNIYGTMQLLDAIKDHEIPHLIFSSTCATYGNPQYLPLDENHPQNPINPYGFTKLVVETMIRDYAAAYGLKAVSLRYFNAAGADPETQLGERHEPETHLIPLVLQAASGRRKSVTIFGDDYPTADGTCIRDYIHINDIAKAHLMSLQHLEAGGETDAFNIGTGHGYSVREIITACERITGRTILVETGPRRPGDPPALVAGADKIRQTLGWTPDFQNLERIIETAWLWEQQQTAKPATP